MEKRLNKGKDTINFMMKGRTLKAIGTLAVLGVATGFVAAQTPKTLDAVKENIVSNPSVWKIVVGADAKASDVIGAVDIATALQYYSKKEYTYTEEYTQGVNLDDVKIVLEKETTKIAGEIPLYTETLKLVLNDNINKIIKVVDSGLVFGRSYIEDVDGNKYYYTQIFEPQDVPIRLIQPEPDEVPIIAIDVRAKDLYHLKVVFENPVNITKVAGKELTLFGKKYYISPDSDLSIPKLVLYESSETVTLDIGGTYWFEGKTIKLIDIVEEAGGNFAALIMVNGKTEKIAEGQSKVVDGLEIYVSDVYVSKTRTGVGYAKLVLGGNKIELDGSTNTVKVRDEELPNVRVTIQTSGNLLTELIFAVDVSDDSSKNYLEARNEFVDPLFGTFKIIFTPRMLHISPEDVSTILVGYSGDDKVYARITDKRGYTKDIYFAKLTLDANSGDSIEMKDDAGNAWKLVEGEGLNVQVGGTNKYIYFLNDGTLDRARLVEVTISHADSGNGGIDNNENIRVIVRDLMSGDVLLDKTKTANDWQTTAELIPGTGFTVSYDDSGNIVIQNNDGKTAVFPVVMGENYELIIFTNDADVNVPDGSGDSNAGGDLGSDVVAIQLPTGVIYFDEYTSRGSEVIAYSLDGTTWTGLSAETVVDIGGVKYKITPDTTNDKVTIEIEKDQDSSTADGQSAPAVVIVEGFASDYQADGVWILEAADSDLNTHGSGKTTVNVAYDSGASSFTVGTTTQTTYYLDEWGTTATRESSDGRAQVTIVYPKEKMWYDVKLVPTEAEVVVETKEVKLGDEIEGWRVIDIEGLPESKKIVEKVGYTLHPLTGIAVLDTEVQPTDNFLIAVGGPAINRITAEFLGLDYPTYGGKLKELEILAENEAVIRVAEMNGKVAVLVFGWEAMDTRRAARAFTQYLLHGSSSYAFYGATEVKVTGTMEVPSIQRVR